MEGKIISEVTGWRTDKQTDKAPARMVYSFVHSKLTIHEGRNNLLGIPTTRRAFVVRSRVIHLPAPFNRSTTRASERAAAIGKIRLL